MFHLHTASRRYAALWTAGLFLLGWTQPLLWASRAECQAADQNADAEQASDGSETPFLSPSDEGPSLEASAADEDQRADKAREHFQRGVTLYTDGDADAAQLEFERAYELHSTYRLLYNLGQVSAERRDYVAAETYFKRYLSAGGTEIESARRKEVEDEIGRLQSRIGTISVLTDPEQATVYVDDLKIGQTPLQDLRLAAGRRRIRVELPGYNPSLQTVDVYGGQSESLRLALSPTPSSALAANLLVQQQGMDSDRSLLATPAFWTGLSTVGFATVAAVFGYMAYKGQHTYEDALAERTTRAELTKLEDNARQDALVTDVMLGAAAVGAITTIVLLIIDDGDERPMRRFAGFGPTPLSASYRTAF